MMTNYPSVHSQMNFMRKSCFWTDYIGEDVYHKKQIQVDGVKYKRGVTSEVNDDESSIDCFHGRGEASIHQTKQTALTCPHEDSLACTRESIKKQTSEEKS